MVLAAGGAPVLLAAPPGAPPPFHRGRVGPADVGGRAYGGCDGVQAPGEFWWTEVWIAGRAWAPAHRPADRWVLAVPPVAAVLAVRYVIRPLGRGAKP